MIVGNLILGQAAPRASATWRSSCSPIARALRGIDIRRLKPTDIDRRGQSVSLTQSKNHGPITCVLNGETMSALADHVLEGRPDRDRFLLSLLYESGGRIGEVLALKAGDLRPTGRGEADVHFYGKGNKHRVTPLTSDPWRHHSEFERACHPGGADPSDPLFYVVRDGRRHMMSHDNVERILARSEKALRAGPLPGLQHLHSHLFRRSRAMHLYLAGVPLPTTSDWLGRSNMETARFYAKVTELMKREAVDKLAEGPGSVFDIGVPFKYAIDEEALKRLCGLR